MRMLTELGKRIDELKNVKKNQSELKKIITKRKTIAVVVMLRQRC